MDATNVVTFTDIVGIGYHHQEWLVHPKAIITTEDNHHALDTPEIDVMTGEAAADLLLGCTQETEAQAGDTHWTATELKADPPTDSGQVTIDHRLRMPGIILGVDHPHATMTSHIDIV